jgi:hypothetical protein
MAVALVGPQSLAELRELAIANFVDIKAFSAASDSSAAVEPEPEITAAAEATIASASAEGTITEAEVAEVRAIAAVTASESAALTDRIIKSLKEDAKRSNAILAKEKESEVVERRDLISALFKDSIMSMPQSSKSDSESTTMNGTVLRMRPVKDIRDQVIIAGSEVL